MTQEEANKALVRALISRGPNVFEIWKREIILKAFRDLRDNIPHPKNLPDPHRQFLSSDVSSEYRYVIPWRWSRREGFGYPRDFSFDDDTASTLAGKVALCIEQNKYIWTLHRLSRGWVNLNRQQECREEWTTYLPTKSSSCFDGMRDDDPSIAMQRLLKSEIVGRVVSRNIEPTPEWGPVKTQQRCERFTSFVFAGDAKSPHHAWIIPRFSPLELYDGKQKEASFSISIDLGVKKGWVVFLDSIERALEGKIEELRNKPQAVIADKELLVLEKMEKQNIEMLEELKKLRGERSTGKTEQIESTEKPSLDQGRNIVRVAGKSHALTEKQFEFVFALFEAKGGWVKGETLGFRVDRIRRRMPRSVEKIISTSRNGYRIKSLLP